MSTTDLSNVLSPQVIATAFRAMAAQEDFAKKLEWWLISPHAAERWIQFELAYALNLAYAGKYVVACECKRVDLAVLDHAGKSPIWENPPIALMELKVLGNWYVQPKQISDFLADIKKVDGYEHPSLALAVCIEVQGEAREDHYKWCFEQIESLGRKDLEAIVAELGSSVPLEPIECVSLPTADLAGFSSIRIGLYAYRNEKAQ